MTTPKDESPQSEVASLDAMLGQLRAESMQGAPGPLDATDDEALAAELAAARQHALQRFVVTSVLATILTLAVAATVAVNRDELAYAAEDSVPVDLGDLDAALRSGGSLTRSFEHNRFVRLRNALLIEEREGAPGTFYFFDPLTNLVGVTTRPLPEKGASNVPIHAAYVPYLTERWVLPDDLTAAFSGEGRLLVADEAPRTYREVADYYRKTLDLDGRRPDQPVWVFIDGVTPTQVRKTLWVYAAALLAVVMSAWLTLRARLRVRQLEREVREAERAG